MAAAPAYDRAALKPAAYIALLAAAFVAGGVGLWLISGDDEEPATTQPLAGGPVDGGDQAGTPLRNDQLEEDEPLEALAAENRARRAVRRYIEAIDSRDGALLCGLVDGIADLELPVRRETCAESVSESIGYRDPRGVPVFETATVAGAPEVELERDNARATVTVVTEFADRDEPSIEDDLIYLVRRGDAWGVAKASSTLYRAIGVSDVSPDVLEPPD
jgi:hypothetical protein